MVSSLVQDLAPPDSAARPQKPSNAGDSSSRQAQLQHGRVESEHTGVAPEASIPDAEPKAVPMEVEKPRVRKVWTCQLTGLVLCICMLKRMGRYQVSEVNPVCLNVQLI